MGKYDSILNEKKMNEELVKEEVKEAIQCNICYEINDIGTHYCKKCGRNLSDETEKTDILFVISKFLNGIGVLGIIIGIVLIILHVTGLDSFLFFPVYIILAFAGKSITFIDYMIGMFFYIFIPSFISFRLSSILNEYALKLCKKNLELE